MKTYDEILEDLCQQHYGMSFVECCEKIVYNGLKTIARHAAHEYTKQSIAEHLERAALSGVGFRDLEDDNTRELYENIRNIEIILK